MKRSLQVRGILNQRGITKTRGKWLSGRHRECEPYGRCVQPEYGTGDVPQSDAATPASISIRRVAIQPEAHGELRLEDADPARFNSQSNFLKALKKPIRTKPTSGWLVFTRKMTAFHHFVCLGLLVMLG